jgi:hypothetical protein
MAYLDKMAKKVNILAKTRTNLEGNLWFKFRKNKTELKLTIKRIEWYIICTISSANLLDLFSKYIFEKTDITNHKTIDKMKKG